MFQTHTNFIHPGIKKKNLHRVHLLEYNPWLFLDSGQKLMVKVGLLTSSFKRDWRNTSSPSRFQAKRPEKTNYPVVLDERILVQAETRDPLLNIGK